ncbi:MAG: hypothetical protein KKG75_00990 [Nanoarchaeota archaeon]|nr:hypothetical protein [Nanoarchaeota archaeon]
MTYETLIQEIPRYYEENKGVIAYFGMLAAAALVVWRHEDIIDWLLPVGEKPIRRTLRDIDNEITEAIQGEDAEVRPNH